MPGVMPDDVLVARIAAGDDRAFAEVYDRHSSLVFGLARRVTGSTTAAEDIAQEVFVHLWEHPDRFDPTRGTLRAYLGVMSHRRAVDRVRKERRRSDREEGDAWSQRTLDASAGAGGEDAVVAADVNRRVAAALECLPPEQREAVVLAYYGGHTYREVAVQLGIPEGTAKSRLRLALAKLGDTLAAEGAVEWIR